MDTKNFYSVDPEMWTRRQFRIAVIGAPDVGKSRLVSELASACTGRKVEPDTLMDEVHYSDGQDPYGNPDTRTIKCARIFVEGPWINNRLSKDVSVVLYDCPGHLEYISQIREAVHTADMVIYCTTQAPKQDKISTDYITNLRRYIPELCQLEKEGRTISVVTRHKDPKAHTYFENDAVRHNFDINFDSKKGFEVLQQIRMWLANELLTAYKAGRGVNLVKEALGRLESLLQPYPYTRTSKITNHNLAVMFSGGKDSVVGVCLLRHAAGRAMGCSDVGPVYYWGYSGYDFPELSAFINSHELSILLGGYCVLKFSNAAHEYKADLSNASQMLQDKAEANMRFAKGYLPEYMIVSYRASDEGVRSKDNWISDQGFYKKVSPVFDFSEIDIWHYISLSGVPVCSLYHEGYRSLGDAPLTVASMPRLRTAEEIIEYLIQHPETTERDGRTSQDNAEPHTMEKLRNVGFF